MLCLILSLFSFTKCKETDSRKNKMEIHDEKSTSIRTVYLQPLGKVQKDYLLTVTSAVKEFYGYDCVIKPPINFSNDILAPSKTRYEASKILSKYQSPQNVLILTEKDITINNEQRKSKEWGVLGLGRRPGTICVVSTFRMKTNATSAKIKERLKKVALHEIGHNLGLVHCTNNPECMMNSANGTIHQVDREKIWMCEVCSKKIKA
jgi:archaemetzincin